jgi:hypothetical protein
MNRESLNEFFEYTTFTWESYGKALERLPADALSRRSSTLDWDGTAGCGMSWGSKTRWTPRQRT